MIVTERLNSRNLAGNVLGDPSERDLVIFLPPSYDQANRRYPTMYLLHWYSACAIDHTRAQWWGGNQVLLSIISMRCDGSQKCSSMRVEEHVAVDAFLLGHLSKVTGMAGKALTQLLPDEPGPGSNLAA